MTMAVLELEKPVGQGGFLLHDQGWKPSINLIETKEIKGIIVTFSVSKRSEPHC